MNQLFEWLGKLFSSWKFWIVIPPWDMGIRVRLGKNAIALSPGPHFRIPLIDEIVMVNTRLRVATTPPVIIQGGGEGKSKVISGIIGYRVSDPLKAVLCYEHPSIAVQAYAQTIIAKSFNADDSLKELSLAFNDSGIEIEFVRFVTNVEVFTLKLLQNERDISSEGYYTNALNSSGDPRY